MNSNFPNNYVLSQVGTSKHCSRMNCSNVAPIMQKQYRDALKLAENISSFSKHLQYAHYRPTRSVMEDRKGWWHYVYTAVSEDRKKARCALILYSSTYVMILDVGKEV